MPAPQGDPDGPPARPRAGGLGGLWQRLTGSRARAEGVPGAQAQGTYSREALQAMIQRKRHNDQLRHREFDALRKLRRTGVTPAPVTPAHPVPFHSSMPSSPDERATTLRKIDEIEAQMSIQWHRVKAKVPARPASHASASSSPQAVAGSAQSGASEVPGTARVPLQARVTALAMPPVPAGLTDRPAASHPADFVHDPELEEAALRFASGDAAGAERALLALLAPGQPRADEPESWLVLFDLYRATGQQGLYEERAADYAARFQRSPPQWRRLHEPQDEAGARASEAASALPASALGEPSAFDWACPAVLDAAGVAALQDTLARHPQPWRLSWAALASVTPDAVASLAHLVALWVRQPVRLRFAGADRLERILDARTACGDRSGDPAWWTLRMDWLRAMRRADEFELVALDYCVTFEVSPPAWDPARCDIRVIREEGSSRTDTGFEAFESRVSALGVSELSALSSFGLSAFVPAPVGELAGTLVGSAAADLARLDAALQDADVLVISCSRLERIDFQAAGELVNWVAARQAEGRAVHLTDVHRMVAPLLGAMGLPAQARINLRRD